MILTAVVLNSIVAIDRAPCHRMRASTPYYDHRKRHHHHRYHYRRPHQTDISIIIAIPIWTYRRHHHFQKGEREQDRKNECDMK